MEVMDEAAWKRIAWLLTAGATGVGALSWYFHTHNYPPIPGLVTFFGLPLAVGALAAFRKARGAVDERPAPGTSVLGTFTVVAMLLVMLTVIAFVVVTVPWGDTS